MFHSAANKLNNHDCVKVFENNGIIFLSECWQNVNTKINLAGYTSILVPRKRCRGGRLVLLYKEHLNDKVEIVKVEHDSIIWIRCDKSLFIDDEDTYICFVYLTTK